MSIDIGRPVILITDDPWIAASISSKFSKAGVYFAVFHPPRLARPDHENEVLRLINVIQQLKPIVIMYGNQPPEVADRIKEFYPSEVLMLNDNEINLINDTPLQLDRTDPDIAQKLYDQSSSHNGSKLAVICERSRHINTVIAANYAIAEEADYYLIDPPVNFDKHISDKLNIMSDTTDPDIRKIELTGIRKEIKAVLPQDVDLSQYEKIMFITEGVPYGVCLPKQIALHAYTVNLCQLIAGNIIDLKRSEAARRGMIGLIDRDRTMSTKAEEGYFADALLRTQGITKVVTTNDTTFTEYEMMTMPYDVLYIATHGQQTRGHKYEYIIDMPSGSSHTVITLESKGTGGRVVYIESVDGVLKQSNDWKQAHAEVWGELFKSLRGENPPKPIDKGKVMMPMRELVLGTDTEDGMASPINFHRLASGYRPLVIANACGSWNTISGKFLYAGASVFIGTLWPIKGKVAALFAEKYFDRLFLDEHELAFHATRKALTGIDKYAYQLSGTFENRFGSSGGAYSANGIEELKNRIKSSLTAVEAGVERQPNEPDIIESHKTDKMYFEHIENEFDRALSETSYYKKQDLFT